MNVLASLKAMWDRLMHKGKDTYQAGRPWAICDRCGFKYRADELKLEWDGLRVCAKCWDPKPAELTPPRIDPREGAPIPNPRPEPDASASAPVVPLPPTPETDPGTPIDPGTTPPAPSTDPLSILNAGLSSTYALASTTGPVAAALTKSLPANAAQLPAGATLGTQDGPTLFINHAGAVNLSGWTIHGYKILVTGSTTVATLTDCDIQNDGAVNYNIQVGEFSDTPVLNLVRCKTRGDGNKTNSVMIFVAKGSTLTATDTDLSYSNSNHIKSQGVVTLTRVRMGPFGQRVASDAHWEAGQFFSRTNLTINGLLIDMRGLRCYHEDGSFAPGGSAFLFIDSASNDGNADFLGNVDTDMRNMVLLGAADLGIYYSIYAAYAPTHYAAINVTTAVIEAGFNGGYSTHGPTHYSFSGVLDFATAVNKDAALTA